MENVGGVKQKSKRKESRYGKRYGVEFELRCVKLRLGEKDESKISSISSPIQFFCKQHINCRGSSKQ